VAGFFKIFFHHFTTLNVFVPCQNGATTTTVNNSLVSIVGGGSSPLRRARVTLIGIKTLYKLYAARVRAEGQGERRCTVTAVYRHKAYYYVRAEFYGRAPSSVLSSSAPGISINFFHFANRLYRCALYVYVVH